ERRDRGQGHAGDAPLWVDAVIRHSPDSRVFERDFPPHRGAPQRNSNGAPLFEAPPPGTALRRTSITRPPGRVRSRPSSWSVSSRPRLGSASMSSLLWPRAASNRAGVASRCRGRGQEQHGSIEGLPLSPVHDWSLRTDLRWAPVSQTRCPLATGAWRALGDPYL